VRLQVSARLETAGCDFTPHPHTVALILAQRLAHANHFADNSSWGETLQSSPTSLRRRVEMLLCAQRPTFSRSDFRPLFEQIVNAWPTVSNYQGDESRSIRQSLLPLAWRCERIAEFACLSGGGRLTLPTEPHSRGLGVGPQIEPASVSR